ncbi:hypothetical protein B0H16DRAFT_1519529 [Mycena metata]|uniref:Uncharacterized protein n=1 Tax=Mycena metata TaxID=1033252 RepID=A0AAD7JP79_9AGAR|nr:hypothetical protein B0H16DRAFT_1519529 [Mycena metata]
MSSLSSSLSFSLYKAGARPLVALVGAGIKVAFLVASKSPSIRSSSAPSTTRMRYVEPSKTSFGPENASPSPAFIATGAIAVTTLFLGVLYAKGFFGRGDDDDGNENNADNDGGGNGGEVPGRGDPPGADPTNSHGNDPGPDLDDGHAVDTGEEPPPPPPPGPGVRAYIPRPRILVLLLLILLAFYFRERIRQTVQLAIRSYQLRHHWFVRSILRGLKRVRGNWLSNIVLNFALRSVHVFIVLLAIYALYNSMWLYANWVLLPIPRMAVRFSIRHSYLGSSVASVLAGLLGFAIYCDYLTITELLQWLRFPVLVYVHGGPLFKGDLYIDDCFSPLEQNVLFAIPAVVFVYRTYRKWVTSHLNLECTPVNT